MMGIEQFENPFTVTTPEDMSAEDTVSLFVDVFTDFPKVKDPGHLFLHGPRGSGKSMMFRYLLPDCQCMRNNSEIKHLNFFAIYLPIKTTYLRLAEFQRLEGRHANVVLNEHFMVVHFLDMILATFLGIDIPEDSDNLEATKGLMDTTFLPLLISCGFKGDFRGKTDFSTVKEYFTEMKNVCLNIYREIMLYFKRLSFHQDIIPYENALCGYLDFLYPLLRELKKLPFMPKGPIFLLIDDADYLSDVQTMILNSWVSTRTSSVVSIKISTQHQYKTYFTVTGNTIDTPHDYAEVSISTVYTNSIKGKYMDRVKEIVKKRLTKLNLESDPYTFFPPDNEQERKIESIKNELREKWERGEGRGNRASDDVVRYARPDYIKSLSGQHKSGSTYSYAGFEQLVHVSSGIIRFFLDTASQMYNDTKSRNPAKPVQFIPPGIQSSIVRGDADKFLFDEIEKISQDQHPGAPEEMKIRQLSNLIQALGGLFRVILFSERSERKIFSIAFSDTPSDKVVEILRLGVRCGYFHESTIGKKDSITGGRTRLYILSRRLAPHFNLDPAGFAGYLFVANNFIENLIEKPTTALNRIKKSGVDDSFVTGQLPLFNE